jgi:hypothetical protein
MHVGCADLNSRGPQHESRGDAARVADPAGRDHRHLHGIDHLRHQREGPDLCGQIVGQKHGSVAAGLIALRDHGIDALRFEPSRFVRSGG